MIDHITILKGTLHDGIEAGRRVILNWSKGDLAAAVNQLEAWTEKACGTLNEVRGPARSGFPCNLCADVDTGGDSSTVKPLCSERCHLEKTQSHTESEEQSPAYRANKLLAVANELYDDAAPQASLTDLLTDARHFADANGLDFANADRIAYDHYLAEKAPVKGGAS